MSERPSDHRKAADIHDQCGGAERGGGDENSRPTHTAGILDEQLAHVPEYQKMYVQEPEHAATAVPPRPTTTKLAFINYSEAISAAETIKNS